MLIRIPPWSVFFLGSDPPVTIVIAQWRCCGVHYAMITGASRAGPAQSVEGGVRDVAVLARLFVPPSLRRRPPADSEVLDALDAGLEPVWNTRTRARLLRCTPSRPIQTHPT